MTISMSEPVNLPEWFLNADYTICSEFTPFEWLIHLRARRYVRLAESVISYGLERADKTDEDEEFIQWLVNNRDSYLDNIHRSPTHRFPDESNTSMLVAPLFLLNRREPPRLQPAVRRPTLVELSESIRVLPGDEMLGLTYTGDLIRADSDYFGGPQEDDVPYWLDPDKWWHQAAYETVADEQKEVNEGHDPLANLLIVDLDHSDEALLESFKAAIQLLRSNSFRPKVEPLEGTKLRFDRWARYSILAYLDLEHWSTSVDQRVPKRVFADALSRIRHVGEENIRKTIHPTAKQAIAYPTLIRLESYVASQQADNTG